MCVGYTATIIELVPDLKCAYAECQGVRTVISVAFLEQVSPGDSVLVHAGTALEKLQSPANTNRR